MTFGPLSGAGAAEQATAALGAMGQFADSFHGCGLPKGLVCTRMRQDSSADLRMTNAPTGVALVGGRGDGYNLWRPARGAGTG